MVGSAALSYARRSTSASIAFVRATNAGSGVLYGALSDSVNGAVRKQFSRDWQGALTASYSKNTSLAQIAGFEQSYQSNYGGGQLSRRLSRSFSAYFSYTAVTQTETNPGILTASLQRPQPGVRVGITYSPGAQHLGHF